MSSLACGTRRARRGNGSQPRRCLVDCASFDAPLFVGRRWNVRFAFPLCCLYLIEGCLPALGEEERVQVITYQPDPVPAEVPLALTSLQPLETGGIRVFFGGTLEFMGGARVQEAATPLHARVERGTNGTLVPTDYLTLLGLCVLHHLEVSRRYIEGLGVPGVREEAPYEIYLHPEVRSAQLGSFRDNMAYVRGANWFLVAPEDEIDALPLACNRAVVAHEFGHAVSFQSDPTARFPSGDIIAIDEGFSDVIGAGVTMSASGLQPSIRSNARDLDVARVDDVAFPPHDRGAVLASVFWAYRGALVVSGFARDEATDAMVRLALETMVSFRGETDFLLVDFVRRAIELAPRPALFCQRAPLAYPGGEVTRACE